MNGEYRIGDVVLGNWELAKLLGQGAYGKVFEAHREDFGTVYKAAIKIMTIPESQSEIANARAEGMDDESITAYFRSFVGDMVQEFALMSKLKGTANIVSYEDHSVIPHTTGIGWDMLIRMELLTPMLNHMSTHPMMRNDVIKLGIDMCRALELCQRYNIIHRDIKPENIFISDSGDYKLGDFGVARTLEKTQGGLSKKGTYTYMAPEIYRDEKYGSTVDIYSLGIVLYRLLNNNRAPFLPAPPQPITHSERERALVRRISGEPLPPPANAGQRLSEIVLKACAYDPKDRYSSPLQMRQELEAIQYNRMDDPAIYGKADPIRVDSGAYTKGRGYNQSDATVFISSNAGPNIDPRPVAGSEIDDDITEKITIEKPQNPVTVTVGKAEFVQTETAAAFVQEKPTSNADSASDPQKKKKTGLIAGIVGAAAVLIALLIILLSKGSRKAFSVQATQQPVASVAKTEQTTPPPIVESSAAEPAAVTPSSTDTDPETSPVATRPDEDVTAAVSSGNLLGRGEWDEGDGYEFGHFQVVKVNDRSIHVELVDNRIPDGFTISETPGELDPYWNLTLSFPDEDTADVFIFADKGDSFQNLSSSVSYNISGATIASDAQKLSVEGSTIAFDLVFPENVPYAVDAITKVACTRVMAIKDWMDASVTSAYGRSEFLTQAIFDTMPVLLDEELKHGQIQIFRKDETTMIVNVTDNRVPDGLVMHSAQGNENAPCFNIVLTLDTGDTAAYSTFLGISLYGEETLNFSDAFQGILNDKTYSFEIKSVEPYSLERIRSVAVEMVRKQAKFIDHAEFTLNFSQKAAAEDQEKTWRELPIQIQGDDVQILSVRYRGGPEIEKIEFFSWGGINGGTELDTYFINNTQIAVIEAGCSTSLPISEEDIELWWPFAKKYLKERGIPSTSQNPIAMNYGRFNASDFAERNSEYELWYGVDSEGNMVSVIIVEIGIPLKGTISSSNLALREGPGVTNKSLGQYYEGKLVYIYYQEGDYYYVMVAGTDVKGYMPAQFIKVEEGKIVPKKDS